MKIIIDTTSKTLVKIDSDLSATYDLYSKQAFELISHEWLRVGWSVKYPYVFSWLGRPIIQVPEDIVRSQEVVYRVKPDVIIETGIAHGGSLIFYASLCKAMGKGRVIGVDIDIRPHNRSEIERHELFPFITLIEGSSVAPDVVNKVKSLVKPGESVLVFLDSNHTKQHVLNELESYHGLVTPGSYIVATDGSMQVLSDVPRGKPEWEWDNPVAAVLEFAQNHPEFDSEQPAWTFNESELTENITHWTSAWLKRSN